MHGVEHHELRVLLISSNKWVFPSRLAVALGEAGFRIAALGPTRSPVYRLETLQARFRYRSYIPLISVRSAIRAWSPDILVCSDDIAVRAVHSLYREALRTRDDAQSSKIVNLIEVSFGNLQSAIDAQSKSYAILLAESLGIRCPRTRALTNKSGLERIEHELAFPLILKADDGWGGLGVRLVNDALELRVAIAELLLPQNWPRRAKRLVARRFWRVLNDWWAEWPHKLSAQEYIIGNPCNRAVVCWRGRVLAGITVDVLATSSAFGPATAVKIIDHPYVEDAAAKIIAQLGLSGFIGLDFIHDRVGCAWFLEVNARATPTCCIAVGGQDLAGALIEELAGIKSKAERRKNSQDKIMLLVKQTTGIAKRLIASEEVDAPDCRQNVVESSRARKKGKVRKWFCSFGII